MRLSPETRNPTTGRTVGQIAQIDGSWQNQNQTFPRGRGGWLMVVI
jgi:hypothetical protein